MRIGNSAFAALAVSVAGFVPSDSAQAAVFIDIQEVGSDVVAITSGGLDLTGLDFVGTFGLSAGINPGSAQFTTVDVSLFSPTPIELYDGVDGPGNFGSGSVTQESSATGDPFTVSGRFGRVGVPNGYISGAPLAATTIFAGETLASLGAAPGTYVFNTPNDTITVNIGTLAAAVPEPATWAMMMLGFFAVGGAMRTSRRKEKVTVSYA